MKNVLLLLVIAAGIAMAHHGYAAFDTKSEVTFTGTVSDFHWTNPHCIVDLDVKNDKGDVRTWHGEMTSPAHLAPRGWTAATLEVLPGDFFNAGKVAEHFASVVFVDHEWS